MAVASKSGTRAGWKSLRTTSMAVGAGGQRHGPECSAQVRQARRQSDGGQESESAMIGLVLIEVQQAHLGSRAATECIGLEAGDEERGIELSLPQGSGGGVDILLNQHGPRIPFEDTDSSSPLTASIRMAIA